MRCNNNDYYQCPEFRYCTSPKNIFGKILNFNTKFTSFSFDRAAFDQLLMSVFVRFIYLEKCDFQVSLLEIPVIELVYQSLWQQWIFLDHILCLNHQ